MKILRRLQARCEAAASEQIGASMASNLERCRAIDDAYNLRERVAAEWGKRMKGEGPIAEIIAARFKAARKRFGLDAERTPLDVSKFKVPPKAGDQLDLFG